MIHNKKAIYICIWVLFIIYLVSFLLTTSDDFTQDLGRHLKLGEIIVSTKTVPQTNLFSYTHPHFSFINHHWLSEAIFFTTQHLMGINSLIVLKACIIILAIITAAIASGSLWGVGVAFLLSPLIIERADIRPEIFGFFAFSLLLLQLRKVQSTRQLSLYIPFIFLFWVNIHISFILGLFLLGTFFLAAEKNKKNITVCILSIIALFINPNGIQGVLAPLTIFNNYGYSIAENQNMLFLSTLTNDIFIRGYFILLPFIFIALCILCFHKKYFESFILLFFSGLAFYQVRHLPFFVLSAIAIIPLVLGEMNVKMNESIRLFLSFLFISLLLFGIVFFGSNVFFEIFDINKTFGFGYEIENTKVISFLQENKMVGNIFNNFDIGSYLSYRLYPKTKVFVEGRPEAYPSSFFKNIYIPLEEGQNKQDAIFKQYNIHTVVLSHTDQTPWGNTFLSRVLQDNRWKLVFLDPVFIVFSDQENIIDIRTTDAFAKQIDQEEVFFHLSYYTHLLGLMGEETKSTHLIQKMKELRPHACSIIRMNKLESSSPWCSF